MATSNMPAGSPAVAGQPTRPAKSGRAGFWIAVGIAVFFFLCCVMLFVLWVVTAAGAILVAGAPAAHNYVKETVMGTGEDEILMISVRGAIMGGPERQVGRAFGNTVQFVRDQLEMAQRDPHVKAVLFAIDSPGGSITSCDTIYNDVMNFRNSREGKGKPIVSYLGDTAASGGYYVACGSDYIIAHPTCLTGSIGVIMPLVSLEGLFNMIGVKIDPIKSGQRKDMGAFYRSLSAQEREYLQKIVDEMYARFVKVVREGLDRRGHKYTEEQLSEMANGEPVTGVDAQKTGLVDETGYFDDAVQKAQSLAKLTSAKVVTYRLPPSLLGILVGDAKAPALPVEQASTPEEAILNSGPRLFYMWTVGKEFILSSADRWAAQPPR